MIKKMINKATGLFDKLYPTRDTETNNSWAVSNVDSISAAATNTRKPKNCDFFATGQAEQMKFLVVADGIGSNPNADEGAKFVCNTIIENIENFISNDEVNFEGLFLDTQKRLDEFVKKEQPKDFCEQYKKSAYGTTAILAVETANSYKIAYIGNGCIFHFRGNFNQFPDFIHFPWNAINHLNPHTLMSKGQEALYKYFAYGVEQKDVVPTVIQLSKDNVQFGDILIIGTDGISSLDQGNPGKADDGTLWKPIDEIYVQMYEKLRDYFNAAEVTFTNEKTQVFVETYLQSVQKLMDDDTTVGIFISGKCVEYQQNNNKATKA